MTCMSQRARSPSVGVAHAPSVCCVWVGVALRGAIGGLKIRRARTFWFCLLDQPKGKAELRRYVTFVSSGVLGRDPVACNGETSRRGCNSCGRQFCRYISNWRSRHLLDSSLGHSTQRARPTVKWPCSRRAEARASSATCVGPCSPGLWTRFREGALPDLNLRVQPLTCGASYPRRQPNPRCKP